MKLIGLDLDGSLLRSDETISIESINILKEIKNKGHKIILTSGRSYNGIIKYYENIGLDTPIISLSGALITYPDGKKDGLFLDSNALTEMFLDNKNILESLMLNGIDFVTSYKHNYETEEIFNGAKTKNLLEFDINNSNDNLLGGVIIIKDENIKTFEQYFLDKPLSVRYWGSHKGFAFYDLHSKTVSKAKSLKKVLAHYNINKCDFIAIGDGINDVEMISEASVGVAMKNGLEVVKKAANHITAFTNDQDGVALFLKDYLL